MEVINLQSMRAHLIKEKQKELLNILKKAGIDIYSEDTNDLEKSEKLIKKALNIIVPKEHEEFEDLGSSDGKILPLLTKPNIEKLLSIHSMKIYIHEIKKEMYMEDSNNNILNQKEINSFLEDELNRLDFKTKKFEILLRKLECIAIGNIFNPVKDYILTVYNEEKDYTTEEIDKIFRTIKGRTEDLNINYLIFKKWMISLVASQFCHDFRSQGALTFTGKQGSGKSTWFKNLVPLELRNYFKEEFALNTIDKDNYIESIKYWLVELSEIGRTIKDSDRAKSHITKQYDEFRAPYERTSTKHKRNTVYAATVDQDEFLRDDVNRRWWIIMIIDKFDYININYKKLYSELYNLYLNDNKSYYLNWDELKELNEHNKEFNINDETDSLIRNIFDWESNGRYYVSANDIGSIINKEKITNSKIGKALKKLDINYIIINTKTKQKMYEIPMPRKIKKYERELFSSMNYEKVISEKNYLKTEREGIAND